MNNELRIKGILFCLCIILYSLFFIQNVSAHVLQTDGTIGAVVHIDPSDAPVTGSLSTFFFEFKDTKNTFSLADCICEVQILKNSQSIYTTMLREKPVATYKFTEPNIYTIQIKGTASANQFSSFTLSYPIRVEQGNVISSRGNSLVEKILYHIIHYGIFGIGFIVLIVLVIREKKKQ